MVDSKDKRAFQRRALVRLTLLLAIAIVTRVLTWTYAEQAVRSEDSNRHTLQVDAALGRLRAELRTAQSNRFSYLLTGDKSFLAPYRRAAQNARNGAADVTVLTADNPNERHAFGQINPLILSRLSSLDSEVDSRSKSDFDMPRRRRRNTKTNASRKLFGRLWPICSARDLAFSSCRMSDCMPQNNGSPGP